MYNTMKTLQYTTLIIFVIYHSCIEVNSQPLTKISVNPKNGLFVDEYGRVTIFHGINLLYKKKPWYSSRPLNQTWLKNHKQWGFNAVRISSMWTGVEPNKDQFNQTYIEILKTIVKNLESAGMYTLLDMHQDVLSSKFSSYDGVPLWLLDMLPQPAYSYPWPWAAGHHFASWAESYLTEAVGAYFQMIYNNKNGARDYMARFWTKMATEFRDHVGVLGYELINEPWAGDIYTHPSLLLPGIAGKTNLMPLYNVLNSAIRKVDNRTVVFFEPVTWAVYGSGDLGTGFTTVPGGDNYRNVSALSYHYYCWLLTGADEHHPYPFWKKMICDDVLLEDMASHVVSDWKATGGGAFLTEFGLCSPDNSSSSTDTIECEAVMRIADENLQSWTYLSDFDEGVDQLRPFTRAYTRATAGVPTSMKFDLASAVFTFKYIINTSISKPTEIFIPKLHYPNGVNVTVTDGIQWKYDTQENLLYLRPANTSNVLANTEVTVVVTSDT